MVGGYVIRVRTKHVFVHRYVHVGAIAQRTVLHAHVQVYFKQHNRYYVPRQDAQYKYVIVDFDIAISLKIYKKQKYFYQRVIHVLTSLIMYRSVLLSWQLSLYWRFS